MQEIPISFNLEGTIKIDGDSVTLTLNPAQITIQVPKKQTRMSLIKGQTVFDIVLRSAQLIVKSTGQNRFTAADIFHEALKKHPDMKRNSCVAHVIASAPNHPSYDHFGTKKNYFKFLGDGNYKLENHYLSADDR
jgi:hypothetical protein